MVTLNAELREYICQRPQRDVTSQVNVKETAMQLLSTYVLFLALIRRWLRRVRHRGSDQAMIRATPHGHCGLKQKNQPKNCVVGSNHLRWHDVTRIIAPDKLEHNNQSLTGHQEIV